MTQQEIQEIINRGGGCITAEDWAGLSATDAYMAGINGIGPCSFFGDIIPQYEPVWADPGGTFTPEAVGSAPINEPEPVFSASKPISIDVVDSPPPEDQLDEHTLPKEKTVFEDLQSGPGVSTNIWGVLGQAITGVTSLFQDNPGVANGPFDPANNLPGIVGEISPQISTGLSRRAGASCWSGGNVVTMRQLARRRVKMVRQADGSYAVVQYCKPRRMNPLNARALGRAARRLSSFHRISKHIEKVVQRACKGTASRRAPRMYGGSRSCRTKC